MKSWIVDTGPLVAYLDERDEHHEWACSVFDATPWPLETCEAVLSEAFFLLREAPPAVRHALRDLMVQGYVRPSFRLVEQARPVAELMRKYQNVPMAFADACLVRMAELVRSTAVITVDSDFHIYRLHGRRVVPLVIPA